MLSQLPLVFTAGWARGMNSYLFVPQLCLVARYGDVKKVLAWSERIGMQPRSVL